MTVLKEIKKLGLYTYSGWGERLKNAFRADKDIRKKCHLPPNVFMRSPQPGFKKNEEYLSKSVEIYHSSSMFVPCHKLTPFEVMTLVHFHWCHLLWLIILINMQCMNNSLPSSCFIRLLFGEKFSSWSSRSVKFSDDVLLSKKLY